MSYQVEQAGPIEGRGQSWSDRVPPADPLAHEPVGNGSAGAEASGPPQSGSSKPADAPSAEVAAARASAVGHYADDFGGPPVDIQALLGDLAGKLTLDPHDKAKSEQALDELAATKKGEASKQGEEREVLFEQHEEKAQREVRDQAKQQERQLKEGGPAGPVLHGPGPGTKILAQQCGPVTKDLLKARVTQTMQRELVELDENYQKEQSKLAGKVSSQIGQLDAEKKKQEEKVGARIGQGAGELQEDITKRAGVHSQEAAKQQKSVDAEAEHHNQEIRGQGKADQDSAAAAQKQQADLDSRHAQEKAAEIRSRAQAEGQAALAAASTRGSEFVAAASARAKTVPESERQAVIGEGQKRNMTALLEGQKRHQQILAKGEADAKALLAQGKRASEKMASGGKPGATYGDQITANTKAGTDRVDGAAKKAGQDMQAVSGQAVANMQVAAGESAAKSVEKAGAASASMGAAQAEAKEVAEKEQAAALQKMKASYEATKAKIEARGKAELDKIEKAKDSDLCHLERQVSGDLKAMENMAEQADTQMAGQVKLAERKVAAEVAKKKAKMRLSAQQAIVVINGFVAQAKRKIKTADQDTLKDIRGQAQLGQQAVAELGKQALAEVAQKNEAVIKKIEADGGADRAALDAQTKASGDAMAKTAADTRGAVDDQVLSDTLGITGKTIQKKAWYDWTSDKQANTAMNALTSLPKDLQGKAVEKLPADQFKNLLSEVPKARREEFESLVENTADPERKLELWAAYAKSRAHNEAERTKEDQGHWYSRTPAQKAAKQRNRNREEAADHTDDEVDEEVANLRALAKKGQPLTKEAVDELYQRKKLESDIEMKYGVNLTNDVDGGKVDEKGAEPTQRRVWSKSELEQLDSVMGRLPTEHRAQLNRVRRSGLHQAWNKDTKKWQQGTAAAYMTGEGEMRFFDSGISGNMRHTGEQDFTGSSLTPMQETFVHELGHSVDNSLHAKGKGDVVDRFNKAAGWESLNEDALRARMATQGLTKAQIDAQINALNAQRPGGIPNHYSSRTPYTGPDGKLYEIDPYSGNFLAIDRDAMPDKFSGGTAAQQSHWGYARTNQADHFAEVYMMAVHTPKALHEDLVAGPLRERDKAKTQLDTAKEALKTASSPEDQKLAREAVDQAQKNLDRANATVTSRGKQWSIMRDEVNGTGEVDKQSKSGLQGISTDPAKAEQRKEILQKYDEEAAQCATPEQINLLKAKYQSQLEALK